VAFSTNTYRVTVNEIDGRNRLEGLGVLHVRIILKGVVNPLVGCRIYSFGSGSGPVVGFCRHGHEPSGSI
jgi:hypothetical protein